MNVTLAQSLAAFVSAGLGAVLAISIGVSHKQLCALISFAAGVLLSATLFHVLPEAWEAGIRIGPLALALLSGYGLFFFLSRYVSHVCPACAASHFEQSVSSAKRIGGSATGGKFKNVFFLLAIALTIHSMMDGIAIALSPALAEGDDRSIFLTVAIHKLPEGLALCALLLKAGHEKTKALLTTFIFESSTLAGWLVGSFLVEKELALLWLHLGMVHIAGGFLYLALHATINEARDHSPRLIFTFFFIGLIFMALVR